MQCQYCREWDACENMAKVKRRRPQKGGVGAWRHLECEREASRSVRARSGHRIPKGLHWKDKARASLEAKGYTFDEDYYL